MRCIKQAGFIVATLFLTLFIACGGGGNDKSSTTTYTVTFDSKGGSPVSKITGLQSGSAINAPSSPSLAGYTFGGWAASSTSATPVSFPYTVTGNVTLYAIWNLIPSGAIEIRTQADLENIRNDLSGDYVLAANISLTGNWEPVGTWDDPFEGTFDGGAYTISGMEIITLADTEEPVGFFGYVYGAEIYNLHLTDVDINAETYHAGGIAGYAKDSLIIGCDIEGSVFSYTTNTSDIYASAGGIVGYADNSEITGCYIAGDVTAYAVFSAFAGGIAGRMENNSVITDCVNYADVYADSQYGAYAGGIAGYANNSEISVCYNAGDVNAGDVNAYSASYVFAGGIAGGMNNNSTITDCVNDGDVFAESQNYAYVGGIAGQMEGAGGVIDYCDNYGNIGAYSYLIAYVGGIAGNTNYGEIIDCYNNGVIDADGDSAYAGGIVGFAVSSEISDCYNDETVGAYGYGGAYAGGIAGYMDRTIISDCGNDGDVYAYADVTYSSSEAYAGGIAGVAYGDEITDCYNEGAIAADATYHDAKDITGLWMI